MVDLVSLFEYTILLIVPAIPCVFIFRFLKRNRVHFEGTLLGKIRFTITGPIGAYAVFLLLTFEWIAPKLISDPSSLSVAGNWKIDVDQKGKGTFDPGGRVSIVQKGADLSLQGILEYKDKTKEDVLAKYGEINNRILNLLIEHRTGAVKNMALFEGHIERSIWGYEIEGEYNLLQGERHWEPLGRIVFSRTSWLVVYLSIFLVPLLIFLALTKLLHPGQASVSGPIFVKTILRVGGPIAGYLLVLIISFVGYERLFLALEFKDTEPENYTDFSISGHWDMVYTNINGEIEGEGRVLIQQSGNKIKVNGTATPRVQGKHPHPVSWRSRFGRVSKDGDIFFYYEVEGGRGDRGVLSGDLLEKRPNKFDLRWYDFVKSPGSNIGTCSYTRRTWSA